MPSDQIYIAKTIRRGFGAVMLLFVMPGFTRAQGLANIDAASAAIQSTVATGMPTLAPFTASTALPEAWWTGPIATSSAETLPHGHVLFEPYLFDVRGAGSDYLGSLTYILYGVTDRLTLGAIPTFGSARTDGNSQSRIFGIGDLTLTAQYRLNRAKPGGLMPTIAVVVQRTLPLGRFDRLDIDPDLGIGAGAQSTLIGVYAQRVDRVGNGRPLRSRLNITYSFAPSVRLEGASVYGTSRGFRGTAQPGDSAVVDLSIEYSLTRRIALAADLIYRATSSTSVVDDNDGLPARRVPATHAFSIAPAIEYSWSSRRGVLIGVRLTPKSEHVAASVTPVVAFNAIF
jgi:Putative MetA-pathway of phenol degradation